MFKRGQPSANAGHAAKHCRKWVFRSNVTSDSGHTEITSQLPIEHWHEWIADATVADAMLDRIMQNHHRLTLTGESLRKVKPSQKKEENQG